MLFKNAIAYLSDCQFHQTDIRIENGKIVELGPNLTGEGLDLDGAKVLPGLIDIHSHGCVGCDWSRSNRGNYQKMATYYAQNGITSLCATTMSLPADDLFSIMKEIKSFDEAGSGGAYLHGINMEGPFFSKKKKGAQKEENLSDPDVDIFLKLQEASGGRIKLCDIAPELTGAEHFIEKLHNQTTISIAHTAADYSTAMNAIHLGARHVTHLYNAMTPYTHREPGVVGAAFDSGISAEIICDGFHLHPAVVRSTFKILGNERIALISDSMEACGMPNGEYELGGQAVTVKDGLATLNDGTISGSATNQFECMRRAIRFGVKPEIAIRAATINPAKIIGVDSVSGSIETGKNADLVIIGEDYSIQNVYVRGVKII